MTSKQFRHMLDAVKEAFRLHEIEKLDCSSCLAGMGCVVLIGDPRYRSKKRNGGPNNGAKPRKIDQRERQ